MIIEIKNKTRKWRDEQKKIKEAKALASVEAKKEA